MVTIYIILIGIRVCVPLIIFEKLNSRVRLTGWEDIFEAHFEWHILTFFKVSRDSIITDRNLPKFENNQVVLCWNIGGKLRI